jgi:hypothetical protein
VRNGNDSFMVDVVFVFSVYKLGWPTNMGSGSLFNFSSVESIQPHDGRVCKQIPVTLDNRAFARSNGCLFVPCVANNSHRVVAQRPQRPGNMGELRHEAFSCIQSLTPVPRCILFLTRGTPFGAVGVYFVRAVGPEMRAC